MFDVPPTIQAPGPELIREKAAKHHLALTDEEVETIAALIEDRLPLLERLDSLSPPRPDVEYTTRESFGRPDGTEDPHNAFVTRCYVPGAEEGLLAGYEVGLKDNIAVAGIEMTCGSRMFEGYVPTVDATAVTRLLDAGADITAKTNMGDMALYGSLSATGPTINPRDEERLSGGSSGGSAIAVVTGDVDVALGTDQAGSVRIPAAWSGCVGLKPTFGLVPYTGAVSHSRTYDHIGPMARSVEGCARTLEAIAGPDPLDPRATVEPGEYLDSLGASLGDVEVGLLTEGIEPSYVTDTVSRAVSEALDTLATAGATVESVSVPEHDDGLAIFHALNVEDIAMAYSQNGLTTQGRGYFDGEFATAFGRARAAQAKDFPPSVKLTLVLGQYLSDEYFGQYYAKAQNLSRALAEAYDDALETCDVLALPTMPMVATRRDEIGETDFLTRLANTSPFDATGHPAISIPCGGDEVGLMLVGRRGDDGTVLDVAHAAERALSE